MVSQHRRAILIAAGGLVLVAVAYLLARSRGGVVPLVGGRPGPVAAEAAPPRIDLDRLRRVRRRTGAGQRDILNYGTRRTPDRRAAAALETPVPPPVVMTPPPGPPPVTAPPVPAVPPLNVKYVGSLENKRGLRVAILLTDRKEVLTGQTGEMVANRFKIVKIGYESVDIQDVGSDRVRRIPFKGN